MIHEPEETLIEKVQSGEYGWKEYIGHHSKEMNREYEWFCHRKGLDPDDEESAILFMEYRDKQFEEAILNGDA